MKRANTGQIRVIEAFLAVLIIFSAFAVTANLTPSQNASRNSELASVGLQVLTKLDSDSTLGMFIEEGNWTGLAKALAIALPLGVVFNVTVLNDQMQHVNTELVSNGGFASEDIAFIEYVCCGGGQVFQCYVVYLWLGVAS
jgi:hypothetical protein